MITYETHPMTLLHSSRVRLEWWWSWCFDDLVASSVSSVRDEVAETAAARRTRAARVAAMRLVALGTNVEDGMLPALDGIGR